MTRAGIEVNDRILRRRRYAWQEIQEFLLLNPEGHDVPRVGFRLVAVHHRTLSNRICRSCSGLSRRDGMRPDGLITGGWDRPAGDAVNLLNEWRMRYTAA